MDAWMERRNDRHQARMAGKLKSKDSLEETRWCKQLSGGVGRRLSRLLGL